MWTCERFEFEFIIFFVAGLTRSVLKGADAANGFMGDPSEDWLRVILHFLPSFHSTHRPSLPTCRPPPFSLHNLGNTCFLNAVIQCLVYTPPLARFALQNIHQKKCDLDSPKPFCSQHMLIFYFLLLSHSLQVAKPDTVCSVISVK